MRQGDTIVALSSGSLPAGVAVVRLSGMSVGAILKSVIGYLPDPRQMVLRDIAVDGVVLDRGLAVYFPSPYSFTGEDCAELHLHGSPAVVRALLCALAQLPDVRLAEAGEFTRRAFENGKLDLSAVDGLGDLIIAETEGQRQQALARMSGGLLRRVEGWRQTLLNLRAEIEARLDFSDESDVDLTLPPSWHLDINALQHSLHAAIGEADRGRIVRTGFRVALAGPPNAGKSSLLNALAQSDLAIVSSEAGTTRDVREVPLDLNGQLVIFVDMAGLRETTSIAEAEGVRRAEKEIAAAHLVLWLEAPDMDAGAKGAESTAPRWVVRTKSDLGGVPVEGEFSVSARTGAGIDTLMAAISTVAASWREAGEMPLVSRERDLVALRNALNALERVSETGLAPELAAESLRLASDALGRLIGSIDSEQVLDHLFAQFCIGK